MPNAKEVLMVLLACTVLGCVDTGGAPAGGSGGGSLGAVTQTLESRTPLVLERLGVVWLQLQPPARPQVNASFCRFPAGFTWAERIAEEGGCRLLDWPAVAELDAVNLDVGEVVLEVGGASVPLAAPDPGWPCRRESVGALPPIAPGDVASVRATGGADVAAFELSLIVPGRAVLRNLSFDREYFRGDEWHFAWSGDPAGTALLEILGGGADGREAHSLISCRGDASGGVSVPATLTAVWPLSRPNAMLRVGSEVEVASEDGGASLRITHWESGGGVRATVLPWAP